VTHKGGSESFLREPFSQHPNRLQLARALTSEIGIKVASFEVASFDVAPFEAHSCEAAIFEVASCEAAFFEVASVEVAFLGLPPSRLLLQVVRDRAPIRKTCSLNPGGGRV
jgi:hypothetical protein